MFTSIEKEEKTSCEAIFESDYSVYLDTWCNTVRNAYGPTDGRHHVAPKFSRLGGFTIFC